MRQAHVGKQRCSGRFFRAAYFIILEVYSFSGMALCLSKNTNKSEIK
jgi:hypothetical protein